MNRYFRNFKNFSGLALVTGGVLCLSSNSSMPSVVSNDKISVSQSSLDVYDEGTDNYVLSEKRTLMDKFNEFYEKKVNSNESRVTGLSSTDVVTSTTNTTSTSLTSTSITNDVTTGVVTTDFQYEVLDEDYSQCMYMKSKYFYVDSFETYVVSENDIDLETICRNIDTPSVYDIWDYLPYTVDSGDTIIYPVKKEYYVASKGEKIEDIAYLNGIDESVIRGLNGIPNDLESLDFNTNILLHTFKGKSTSYDTNKGVSNVVNNNKIFADKLVSVGESGSEKVLGLLNDRFIYGSNYVSCYKFDGNGNYSIKNVCANVRDIDVVDGELAAYIRDEDCARNMAINCGISNPDSFSISQFITRYNSSYDIYLDKYCESYIKCDEGRQYVR